MEDDDGMHPADSDAETEASDAETDIDDPDDPRLMGLSEVREEYEMAMARIKDTIEAVKLEAQRAQESCGKTDDKARQLGAFSHTMRNFMLGVYLEGDDEVNDEHPSEGIDAALANECFMPLPRGLPLWDAEMLEEYRFLMHDLAHERNLAQQSAVKQ